MTLPSGGMPPDLHADWSSLEFVFRAFPSSRAQRQVWREMSQSIHQRLLQRGHMGLPALLPGLVHARLATALLAAGYRRRAQLANQSILCLGCHAGLEIRILKDFNAGDVRGVEIRSEVITEAVACGLIAQDDVWIGDFWDFLKSGYCGVWDEIVVLAPEQLSLAQLWPLAQESLLPGGHLVVVAQPSDVMDIPVGAAHGSAMEGTMMWLSLTREE